MPRFFCDNITDSNAVITGEDAKHISKVLRYKINDELIISDLNGFDYECKIISISDDINLEIILEVLNKYKNKTEPSVEIVLYQALPKGDKFDFIIQKAVEIGVYKIVPVLSKYCVSRPDEKSFEKKLLRYNKIAKEAAKQSGRGIIPLVENIITFEEAIKSVQNKDSILFYEGGGKRINDIINKDIKHINIFIGSEGGFSQEEVNLAKENNVGIATLGSRILRCETAPLVSMSVILNVTENI